jgi:hypothetical protein
VLSANAGAATLATAASPIATIIAIYAKFQNILPDELSHNDLVDGPVIDYTDSERELLK